MDNHSLSQGPGLTDQDGNRLQGNLEPEALPRPVEQGVGRRRSRSPLRDSTISPQKLLRTRNLGHPRTQDEGTTSEIWVYVEGHSLGSNIYEFSKRAGWAFQARSSKARWRPEKSTRVQYGPVISDHILKAESGLQEWFLAASAPTGQYGVWTAIKEALYWIEEI